MKKPNYEKLATWFLDAVRANGGTIVGGLSMIGLSLLCRKLGVPYQVLTDPAYARTRTSQPSYNHSEYAQTLYLMPTDAVEASIAAIYNSSVNLIYDSEKLAAAKEIMSVIAARKDDIPDTTVTYAISMLQALAKTMIYDSNKRTVTQFISKLGKGDF
jgi:hypothetical protein